jgi:antagonist of KipI
MSVRVLRPGLLTSLQDLGRYGLQHLGIVPCGAMDQVAHRIANALVGNPATAATLECTVLGPELVFGRDSLVALYGAAFEAKSGGKPFPRNRPVLLSAGTVVSMGAASRGARAYLAIAGGFRVPEILGSLSTYIPAGFGGLGGRALKAGDVLAGAADLREISAARFAMIARRGSHEVSGVRTVRWSAPELTLPFGEGFTVRAMEGRHHAQFDAASREAFFGETWRVSPDSNRMGYRLQGPRLTRARTIEILSEPTCLGTVQVPNDGTPIVLMADHQTTGGYPKIAEVASSDIPGLAQLAPGGQVRFVRCTVAEAEAARRIEHARVRAVVQSLGWELRGKASDEAH